MESILAEKTMRPMTEEIIPEDQVSKARKLMETHRMRIIPVTEGRDLMGIIKARDTLKITSSRSNLEVYGLMLESPVIGELVWSLAKVAKKTFEFDV